MRPVPLGRPARPCDRSAYAYTPSGRSPAHSAASGFGVLGLRRRNLPPMAPRAFVATARGLGLALAPLVVAPVASAACSRRDASSAGYGLLASRRAPPRMRRTALPRVAQLGARPLAPSPQAHNRCVPLAMPCAAPPSAMPLGAAWTGRRATGRAFGGATWLRRGRLTLVGIGGSKSQRLGGLPASHVVGTAETRGGRSVGREGGTGRASADDK